MEAAVSASISTPVLPVVLTVASTAALTVYDMCKAVDRGMEVGGLHVALKDGGKSGRYEAGRDGSAQ